MCAEKADASDGWAGGNRLLAALTASDRALLEPNLSKVSLARAEVVFEPGDDITRCHFPGPGTTIGLAVLLPDGSIAETATVGCEGAIGGIVSLGHKPAFARGVVLVGGTAQRIETERLEELKERSATLRDTMSRYADCMIAQILQSVACNALHALEPRLCRWLLTAQDRAGGPVVPLTQEFLAQLLGVQRTTVSAAASALQERGVIRTGRGRIEVLDRRALRRAACPCHAAVRTHFEAVLPTVHPPEPPPEPRK